MRSCNAPLSWARFIMLSLSGARQISGNSVRISIRIGRMPTLLHDLKRRPLPMPGGRTRQQRANRLDRLAVATNDAADIGLPQLDPEDRRFSRGDLRKHHLVRKLDKLANDKFEELFHRPEFIRSYGVVTSGLGAINGASDRSTRLLPAVGRDKILRV